MKTTLLMLLVVSAPVLAQLPQKGDWLVGADVASLSIPVPRAGERQISNGDVALLAGKFVSERVVVGAALPFAWQYVPTFSVSQRTRSYGVVPFVRWYLTNTRLRPYVAAGAGYLFTQYDGDRRASNNGLTYNGNVGLAYFLNRNVSLDAVATVASRPNQAQQRFIAGNTERINVSLRFQVFLNK